MVIPSPIQILGCVIRSRDGRNWSRCFGTGFGPPAFSATYQFSHFFRLAAPRTFVMSYVCSYSCTALSVHGRYPSFPLSQASQVCINENAVRLYLVQRHSVSATSFPGRPRKLRLCADSPALTLISGIGSDSPFKNQPSRKKKGLQKRPVPSFPSASLLLPDSLLTPFPRLMFTSVAGYYFFFGDGTPLRVTSLNMFRSGPVEARSAYENTPVSITSFHAHLYPSRAEIAPSAGCSHRQTVALNFATVPRSFVDGIFPPENPYQESPDGIRIL